MHLPEDDVDYKLSTKGSEEFKGGGVRVVSVQEALKGRLHPAAQMQNQNSTYIRGSARYQS